MKREEFIHPIKKDIISAWEGLIRSRIDYGCYDNEAAPFRKKSRIATAEGIESFLIPCLKSKELKEQFLSRLANKRQAKNSFFKLFTDDIKFLINSCVIKKGTRSNISKEDAVNKGFFSDPYWSPIFVKRATIQTLKDTDEKLAQGLIETTDSVGFVLPAMLHFWHLFKDNTPFKNINFDDVTQVIFEGTQKLVRWHIKNKGWGWGDSGRYQLQSSLFSTWTACECLSELDDIILTPEIKTGENNQLGIDSKSVWEVIRETKDYLIDTYLDKIIQDDPIEASETEKGPISLYNDLYALDALILTYADRKWEEGLPYLAYRDPKSSKRIVEECAKDDVIQSKLELGLYKIIKLYGKEEIKKELRSQEYKFYLDFGNVLDQNALSKNPEWFEYSDKSFIPLLLRVCTLLSSYKLGNPIILDELAKEIYKDLLLIRHTKELKLRHCWDETYFSVYSTQRAIEALTDMYSFYLTQEDLEGPEATLSLGALQEITPLLYTLSFASRLAREFKQEKLSVTLLEDDSLLEILKGYLLKTNNIHAANTDSASETLREMIDLNIEFAHVKNYLSQPTVEVLKREVEEEILIVRKEIDKFDENEYCICVMLDDYNNPTDVTTKNIAEELANLGVRPDYVMRESKLVGVAESLLDSIQDDIRSRIKENGEMVSFIKVRGKDINLKSDLEGKIRYECALLAACWYLVRLGVEPFASEGIKSIKNFSNKNFFARRLLNVLDRERYGDAEEATRRIMSKLPSGASLVKRVGTLLVG